jgi:integrase
VAESGPRGPYRTKPGTLAALAAAFRSSPRYLGWGPGWARRCDAHIDRFVRANAGMLTRDVRRGDIVRARNEFADVPAEATNWLKAMQALFGFALEVEDIDIDPTAGVARLQPRHREGFRVWTEDEIDIFLGHHRPPTVAHALFTLALCTGAARADLVRLGWPNLGERDGRAVIRYRRVKTEATGGPLIVVPVLPPLAALIETLPRDALTWLQTRYGRPRSAAAVTGDMARWVAEAGLDAPDHLGRGLTTHGLRKALGRRLAEAGATEHEIMAVLGHRSPSSAAVYTRAYDRAQAAESGMERLSNISRTTKVLRLRKKTDKT